MNDVVQNIIHFVVTFLFSLLFLMAAATILVYLERKVHGAGCRIAMAHCIMGPHGILQSLLDVGKLLLKEDVKAPRPTTSSSACAPMVFFAPVLTAFVVLPFSPYLTAGGARHWHHLLCRAQLD